MTSFLGLSVSHLVTSPVYQNTGNPRRSAGICARHIAKSSPFTDKRISPVLLTANLPVDAALAAPKSPPKKTGPTYQ